MNIRYGKLFKLPRRIAKCTLSAIYPVVIKIWPLPKVLSIDETLDKIVNFKCSISRFGDGEFLYIIDKLNLPFQRQEPSLRAKLIEVLKAEDPDILVGLPIGYHSLYNLRKSSQRTWRSQITWIYPRLSRYIDKEKTYYNSSITRPYIDFENKDGCKAYFDKLMMIWNNREILLVEGEKSRLGVGNNLFDNAKNVRRILAPSHNAFTKYDEIINQVLCHEKSNLVLIALGPSATVMSFDLTQRGYQAIDIGNVDIEYEWYLRGSISKIKIPGKYTSEAVGGRNVEDIWNDRYESQIIARVF
jgi:glycosyltransferase family protein